MTTLTSNRLSQPLVLHGWTAEELMTPNPKSVRQDATVVEASAFLSTCRFSAAPVIDEAGHPVGVVSRSDLLPRQSLRSGYRMGAANRNDRHLDMGGETSVRDVMTQAVFCVPPEASAAKVVEKMLALNVHRLFVVDDEGILVGVVSAFDVLRALGRSFRVPDSEWEDIR